MNKLFSGNNSRRDFVKGSSLLAGGILAAPLLSSANFFSGADDVIKIAVVGCGGRGTGKEGELALVKAYREADNF